MSICNCLNHLLQKQTNQPTLKKQTDNNNNSNKNNKEQEFEVVYKSVPHK